MRVAISKLLKLNQEVREHLSMLGYELVEYEEKEGFTGSAEVLVGVHVSNDKLVDGLKYIQLCSAGFDHVDLDFYQSHGVMIANGRGMYGVPIAEYCFAHILNIYKNIDGYRQLQMDAKWERLNRNQSIDGSQVLLLGTGDIGQQIAKRMQAFGATVHGMNSNGRMIEGFDACFPLDQLDARIGAYDTVIASLPNNKDTHHLMTEKQFMSMKQDAIFINVGRGQCVDEQGLLKALDQTSLNIILDVFEVEPLDSKSLLWQHPQITITPHASTETDQLNAYRLAIVMANLERYAKHEALKNRIL